MNPNTPNPNTRAKLVERLKEAGYKYETITCDDCADNESCEWAWDDYNTDGDCLATK